MYDKSYYNKWYFIDLLDSYHSILHSDIFITTGAMYYIIYERRKLGEARWRMKNEEHCNWILDSEKHMQKTIYFAIFN